MRNVHVSGSDKRNGTTAKRTEQKNKNKKGNEIAHISFAQCAVLSVAVPILSATFSRGFATRRCDSFVFVAFAIRF